MGKTNSYEVAQGCIQTCRSQNPMAFSVNWWAIGALLCCTLLLAWWGYYWTVGRFDA